MQHVASAEGIQLPSQFGGRVIAASQRNLRRALLLLEVARVQQYPFRDDQVCSFVMPFCNLKYMQSGRRGGAAASQRLVFHLRGARSACSHKLNTLLITGLPLQWCFLQTCSAGFD